MSITFYCDKCGRKIQARDEDGGKWGKCPSCHNKLYVPAPSQEDEELKLAPIDEDDQIKQKQLIAETHKLTRKILLEKEAPEEQAQASQADSVVDISDKKLFKYVTHYLKLMSEGNLDKAGKLARSIAASGDNAKEILNQIELQQVKLPELNGIPHQVLTGFIETLRKQIG